MSHDAFTAPGYDSDLSSICSICSILFNIEYIHIETSILKKINILNMGSSIPNTALSWIKESAGGPSRDNPENTNGSLSDDSTLAEDDTKNHALEGGRHPASRTAPAADRGTEREPLGTLDVHHPLTRRLLQHEHEIQHATYPDPATARRTAMRHIRLIRNAALAPAAERPRLIPQRFSSAIWTGSKERRLTKELQAERIRSWSQIQTRLVVYSDGSKTDQDTAGFRYAVYRRQQLIAQGCGQIGKGEVFDAEIKGVVESLRAALAHQRSKEGITVCIDNTSFIDCIGATAPPSSRMAFRTF
ncbi:hypothetical protein BM221_010813 [Beauveria bassiana]|uniref:RNase H type-1 domain-containing protein n=1 Tax=Beauveria bassiana TaxID=176275 RepID=A0A2N6N7V0_BEABA|nr:hypothetical protein BM221_010813 [Beauveria bassiana]